MAESRAQALMLGKYQLIAELGRGGMAEIFLALANPGSNFAKLVVIKKPREHLAGDVEFMTMLIDEARIAARLNHPNLVQTMEVGEANGQHFLTMEYLDGQPLHRILSRVRATIPLEMHLSILIDVCAGIHYAHELKDFDGTPLGIIHRDVTPHNVFVTYEGQVKVVDFGIAKAEGRAGETRHGVIKGKTPYMAPEQAAGRQVDRRVDIFSTGVMIFEAGMRRRMWKGSSEIDVIRCLINGRVPSSPKALDAAIDDELDRICQKALAFQPEDRYPTAADLQRDLEAYLATKGPRPLARDIGTYCAQLFADKRATTDKIIATQLAYLKSSPMRPKLASIANASYSSSLENCDEIPVTSDEFDVPPPPSSPAPSTGQPVVLASLSTRAPRRRNAVLSRSVVAIALAVAVGTTATTILAFRWMFGSTSGSAAAEMITVTLRATPIETRFSVDDGPPLENPFIGKYPGDGKEHRILATAPGHRPKEEVVVFQSDLSLRFSLASEPKM